VRYADGRVEEVKVPWAERYQREQWPPKSGHGSAKLSYGGWVRERFNG